MKRKKIFISLVLLICILFGGYWFSLSHKTNTLRASLKTATRALIIGQVGDGKENKRALEKTITSKVDLDRIFNLILQTKNCSILKESLLQKVDALASSWGITCEVYSNESHVATIRMIGFRVILNDQVVWLTDETADVYGNIVAIVDQSN